MRCCLYNKLVEIRKTAPTVCPTWPEQALRANILAQISLALNRIWTEWYPSRGYSFNITGSPGVDQAYVSGRTVFAVMEKLTAELFNTYVRRSGDREPYYTEYCDGKTVTCPGMKQWGTVDRAKEGKNALQILRYYYGNDIELVQNAPVRSPGQSYPGTPLRLGSKGDDVLVLKTMINRVSQSYPAIPKLFPVTNVFDESTQQAVKTFQQIFNLTPDGIVGKATWYKLVYLYVGTNQLSELVSMGQQFQTFSFQYPGILRQGDRGSDVRILQYMLALTAKFNESLIPIQVDGIYGNATAQAVRKYQSQAGLQVDGIVGPNTWYSLYNNYTGIERDLRNDNINFPLSQAASAQTGGKTYGTTSRQGQFPGGGLQLGNTDFKGVKLV